ncbi:MAG: hypothetical protein LBQ33_00230 [Oscillospiraceae bacterium]|jgi:hypothetical protein|nr:hypothetical protein [Oscillospiraceae bacterium]
MKQKNGDFFRTARFGGFRKEDVMCYIERLETKLHAQQQASETFAARLRAARRERLRAREELVLLRRQAESARQVRLELGQFQKQLEAAQALCEEIERENIHLRKRVRLLEQPQPEEQEGLPLEQLTFRLFLEDLDEEVDSSEFAYLSI